MLKRGAECVRGQLCVEQSDLKALTPKLKYKVSFHGNLESAQLDVKGSNLIDIMYHR